MKKTIGIVFLSLAVLVAVLYSPWGQAHAKQFFLNKLQEAGVQISAEQFSGTFPSHIRLKNLEIETDGFRLHADSADLDLAWIRILRGQIAFSKVEAEGIYWTTSKSGPLNPLAAPIYVKQFDLKRVQNLDLNLKGSVRMGHTKGSADLSIQYDDLPALKMKAKGSLDSEGWAHVKFEAEDAEGTLDTDGETGRFEIAAKDWSARGQFNDTLKFNLQGEVFGQFEIGKKADVWQIDATQVYYRNAYAEKIELFLHPTLFSLSAQAPNFNLIMGGNWDKKTVEVQTASGTYLNFPFSLNEPTSISLANRTFTPFQCNIGDGFLKVQKGRIELNHVPLEIASENFHGWVDGQANWDNGSGTFSCKLEETSIGSRGEFEGKFDPRQIELTGHASLGKEPLLDIELKAPIENEQGPLSGRITFDGRIEDLLELADFGVHRLEGKAKCNFVLKGTRAHPELSGFATLQDGLYQNDYTGTELKSIQAQFEAKNKKILMTSFRAEGVSATGKMELKNQFPFSIDAHMTDYTCASIDLISAKVKGDLKIKGDLKGALASGEIELIEAELSIPDHIPRPLPELQVIYKNQTHPIAPVQNAESRYPLKLDLHIFAPQNVWIRGRGLTSEWKGDFYLSGLFSSFAARGTLELIEGEFSFSSRHFTLQKGAISLSGQEHEMPYIDLSATTELNGVNILAHMHGPLNNPQLTFQSTPPLPLSSIMSYLLFGQDLSEISGFQALQLASSVASLLGQGPDVMESTRRSLGVDRLRIITSPKDGQEGERVALEVGKYVSEGVLVSFSQGAEEDSTNISVEVELKGGFVFQVETLQEQEQGRFTLKWQINY